MVGVLKVVPNTQTLQERIDLEGCDAVIKFLRAKPRR